MKFAACLGKGGRRLLADGATSRFAEITRPSSCKSHVRAAFVVVAPPSVDDLPRLVNGREPACTRAGDACGWLAPRSKTGWISWVIGRDEARLATRRPSCRTRES